MPPSPPPLVIPTPSTTAPLGSVIRTYSTTWILLGTGIFALVHWCSAALLPWLTLAISVSKRPSTTFTRLLLPGCFHQVTFTPHLLCHVEAYVCRCTHCQQMHTHRHCPYGSLQPLSSPSQPFVTISCDFLVRLPLVCTTFDFNLLDTVLVLTDTGTQCIYLLLGASTWSAEKWSLCFTEQLLPHTSWPTRIISNQDSCLTSQFWHSLNDCFGCVLVFSTVHHKSDGQSEQAIQLVELLLQGLCNSWLDDWAMYLPLVELILGNRVNASLAVSPNNLLYRVRLCDPFTAMQSVTTLGDLSLPDRWLALCQQALDHLVLAQAYMKHHYDLLHELLPKLAIGDWVWLNIHDGYSVPKGLLPPDHRIGIQRIGPYCIKRVISDLAYKLELPVRSRVHPVISIQHLELYVPSSAPVQSHKVSKILREHNTHHHGHQYLVCFDHSSRDQWVPMSTVTNAAALRAWKDRQTGSVGLPPPTVVPPPPHATPPPPTTDPTSDGVA